MIFATPAKLAELLRRDELDAALVSLTEVLLHDRYDVLDGIAIASLGEALQRAARAQETAGRGARNFLRHRLAHQRVNLLKVLLAERGLHPEFKPLEKLRRRGGRRISVLLIGDRAIEFQRAPHTCEIFDLGEAWFRAHAICRSCMPSGR